MVELITLGSGSRGNSTLLRTARSSILIDAGFSARQLFLRLEAVGHDPSAIDAIVITHEHSDHISGVPVFTRRTGTRVMANEAAVTSAGPALRDAATLDTFTTGSCFEAGDFTITPFPISHDAAEPVGFILEAEGISTGYATDLGHAGHEIVERLTGCEIVVVEANHDRNMLFTGPYPPLTKRRIDSDHGHLSNEAAAELLTRIIPGGTRQVVLAHLSETNNIPRLARATIEGILRRNDLEGIALHVAGQNEPGDPVS
ncbi:MBL fold metallo-hydrolase [Candidatus Zixiibacteriota bacterium]